MSSKKASNNPELCPVKDNNLVFIVGLGPKISFRACLLSIFAYKSRIEFFT